MTEDRLSTGGVILSTAPCYSLVAEDGLSTDGVVLPTVPCYDVVAEDGLSTGSHPTDRAML